MRKAMTSAIVLGSIFSIFWTWIVWVVIGGIAGALADQLIQGNRLGILGNIVIGIIGGLIGGIILGFLGISGQGIIWTFVTAFIGAAILLWLINAITGHPLGRRRAR
jgi:uncharacterized membrane protein YeaQ/YmgE (transglycosylase-associated protein family)